MLLKRTLALLLAAGAFGAAAAAPAATLRAMPVASCVTPQKTLYEKRINASGAIEARVSREVYLETPVIARSVRVGVGDYVRKGQVLAEIDTDLSRGVMEQSVPANTLLGGISKDASDLLDLYGALQSSGLLGGSGLESLDGLAQAYGAFGDGLPTEPENGYVYIPRTVTAPMDGVVTAVNIQSDVLSRTSKPLVTISDSGSFVALVTVGESSIPYLKVGDEAVIHGAGFGGKSYDGRVSKIHPVAHRLSGGTSQETVVDVEIAIDNPDDDLKAGFTARAEIVTDTRREMLTVPYEAVRQDENNVEYVYLARDSRAVRRDIRTGVELLEGVEVTEGLTESDPVIANAEDVRKAGAMLRLQWG